ncbi:MAG: T9SS type A sorting domain-containing protein [Bacteroides sp.]|nr:T9SS type A sorting domain-containing protein [Bacteroides sp.]
MRKLKKFTNFLLAAVASISPALVEAQTIGLQVQKPYGWVDAESGVTLSLGNVNVDTEIRYENLRLVVDGIERDEIEVSSDNGNFTSTLEPKDNGVIPISILFSSQTEGTEQAVITFSAPGATPVTAEFTANVENLNAATIFDLKVLANEKGYNTKLYYTGSARINHYESSQWGYLEVYVEDETGGAVLKTYSSYEDFPFHQGDMVTFVTYLDGGEGQPYVTFQNTAFSAVKSEAWEYPSPEETTALSQFSYGKKVIIKNVNYVSSTEIKDRAGERYNLYTTYATSDGKEFTLFPVGEENPYYNLNAPYDSDTSVEIIGIVIPNSPNGGVPTPYLLPMVIRPSVPVAGVKTGKYTASGKSVIYNQVIPWECNVTIDENDPYVYWFEHMLENLRDSYTAIRATLTPDGKKLQFMVGESWTEDIPAGYYCYFTGCKDFVNIRGEENPPYPRGYIIEADIDELSTITFDTFISYLNYCTFWEEIVGVENPNEFRWTYTALFEPGVKFIYETPMPLIEKVNVEAKDNQAILNWDIPSTEGTAYTLTGFSIYCNGILYDQTSADINTWTHSNLRPGTYTYGVAPIYAEGEADITYAEPIEYSSVEMLTDPIEILTKPGMIVINSPATTVTVNDMTGRVVFGSHINDNVEIPVESGVYVIKAGTKSYKVVVK